jgi:hypothetical protein
MRTSLYAAVAAVALAAISASPAAADHPHYSDGSERYEPRCYPDPAGGPDWCLDETGWGPPALVRVDPDACLTVWDPPHWIWLTIHVRLTDGTVAHDTVPYEHDRPGEIDFSLAPYIDGHGEIADAWATWNIGSGESTHTGRIDCTPDPTTTTTQPATTTTVETPETDPPVTVPEPPEAPHHLCPVGDGHVVKTGLETPCPPLVEVGTPATASVPVDELPRTGGTATPLAVVGIALAAIGFALARTTRR